MKLQLSMDKSAMGLSFLCLAHCLVLPSAAILLPAVIAAPLEDELFHQILLIGVIPLCVIALFMGCRKHKSWKIFAWGITGLSILLFGGFFGHDLLGEAGERITTVVGSFFIIFSHLKNYKKCQSHQCAC